MPKLSFTIEKFSPPHESQNTLLLQFKNLRRSSLIHHNEDELVTQIRTTQAGATGATRTTHRRGESAATSSSQNATTHHTNGTQSAAITHRNTSSGDLPHIHVSLVNASNSNDVLLFYASSLELQNESVTEVRVPVSEKCHNFYGDATGGSVNLSVRVLYQDKLERKMKRWILMENEIRWEYDEQLRLDMLREQQWRHNRKEILALNATQCHDTTCTIQRDHLGQCNDGAFFFFEDVILDPFDDIEYEIAKEGKGKGSIQMVMVTKRHGEIILCETPIFSTGGWQQYQKQQARLEENKIRFLTQYFAGSKNLRCERTTLGFYFLGSFGICNIRSVRFYKFLAPQIERSKTLGFYDVEVFCES
mmetsp:Transcript_3139/g.12022  ORF Transcript_3139/g.12022 Transcript_3139/m.12022 type:complete len:362 (-) Transcript_3139:165-1250(-)